MKFKPGDSAIFITTNYGNFRTVILSTTPGSLARTTHLNTSRYAVSGREYTYWTNRPGYELALPDSPLARLLFLREET